MTNSDETENQYIICVRSMRKCIKNYKRISNSKSDIFMTTSDR